MLLEIFYVKFLSIFLPETFSYITLAEHQMILFVKGNTSDIQRVKRHKSLGRKNTCTCIILHGKYLFILYIIPTTSSFPSWFKS